MATMTAVEPPIEGALAWKIDRSDEPIRERYTLPEEGPWAGEPDKMQWVDPDTGLDCLILRNHFGSLCGYVGVPADHPAYEHPDYDDLPVSVHGGLTFSGKCSPPAEGFNEDEPSPGICHVPFPGRPHDIFWLGFDCGHAFDLQPGLEKFERENFPPDLVERLDTRRDGLTRYRDLIRYRDLGYVIGEVTDLAKQLIYIAEATP